MKTRSISQEVKREVGPKPRPSIHLCNRNRPSPTMETDQPTMETDQPTMETDQLTMERNSRITSIYPIIPESLQQSSEDEAEYYSKYEPQDVNVKSNLNKTYVDPNINITGKINNKASQSKHPSNGNVPVLMLCILVAAVAAAVALRYKLLNDDTESINHLQSPEVARKDRRDEEELKNSIFKLRKKFPSQGDVWPEFSAGIKKVIRDEPIQPSTILIIHNGNTARPTVKCLTQELANLSSKFLNGSSTYLTSINGEQLKNKEDPTDNGWLINKYRPLVEYQRVLVVYNLEKIPGALAQVFHYFCDEYSPLVDKAVYLFTLSISDYNKGRPQKVAEEELKKLWINDLEEDKLAALITRITSSVVKVVPEQDFTENC